MAPLKAEFLPDFGTPDRYGGFKPASMEATLVKANAFLQGLNEEGASIKAIIPVNVDMGPIPGMLGDSSEQKYLIIKEIK